MCHYYELTKHIGLIHTHIQTSIVYCMWRLIMCFMGHLQAQARHATVSFSPPEGLVREHKPSILY